MQENQDLIGYDEIIENSMRTVIYETLKKIEKNGLPGKHYFVISFLTNFPETKIPPRLKEKYSDEMTIVMQYQYKDLEVNHDEFIVSLSFAGRFERLTIPYKAVTSFADPSMNFGLKFSVSYEDLEAAEISVVDSSDSANSDEEDEDESQDDSSKKGKGGKKSSKKPKSSAKNAKTTKAKGRKSKKTDTSSKVVSLDEFRKEKSDNNEND